MEVGHSEITGKVLKASVLDMLSDSEQSEYLSHRTYYGKLPARPGR